ncbi:flagellar protein FliO/FliZ [Oceanospirillum multiglobuliferum]|uniref:Flagellar protein n=1 Tax=Oceanospirillum multiglobuliferum TaxID=64969 RepID=A0A1T4L4P2_9GAMM|nr:flagellar biosynthetic protein FliO [Oceanospirillum multiglobuliferum]OPX56804.1 flagellar biosynthetic protein FliO [Oceanospirillum multiglobuliferum]SJZ49603.1 flagellar protein FliO/FliZ [Oceanospirillum multiglobuliferum]
MLKSVFIALICLISLGLSSLVRAQTASESLKASTVPSAGLPSSSIEDIAISLAVVLLVIILLAWLAKRFVPNLTVVDRKAMKVLAVLPLGGKERILLVDVAGVQMVLGVSISGVNCLHVFSEPVLRATPEPDTERFRSLLQSFKNNREAP